jgi:hypothetical protein
VLRSLVERSLAVCRFRACKQTLEAMERVVVVARGLPEPAQHTAGRHCLRCQSWCPHSGQPLY